MEIGFAFSPKMTIVKVFPDKLLEMVLPALFKIDPAVIGPKLIPAGNVRLNSIPST